MLHVVTNIFTEVTKLEHITVRFPPPPLKVQTYSYPLSGGKPFSTLSPLTNIKLKLPPLHKWYLVTILLYAVCHHFVLREYNGMAH